MRADFRLDQAALERHRDGLCPRLDAQLREDVLDVCRHRLRADDERSRDLTLRSPFGQEREDLALARAEICVVSVTIAVRYRSRAPQRALDACEELAEQKRELEELEDDLEVFGMMLLAQDRLAEPTAADDLIPIEDIARDFGVEEPRDA